MKEFFHFWIHIKRNIVAGFSISPKLGRSTVMHLEVNYKDLDGQFDDVDSSRKIAAGFEIEWFRMPTIYIR